LFDVGCFDKKEEDEREKCYAIKVREKAVQCLETCAHNLQ